MSWQMKDSNMDPKWVEDMWAKFPCQKVIDQNGVENGNYRTGPVRGSFLNILSRSPVKQQSDGSKIGGKYGGSALFPLAADLSLLATAAKELALTKWPDYGKTNAEGHNIGPKLKSPFNQQADKLKFDGYMHGGIYITAVADQRAPYAVNTQGVPITDEALIYPGAWYFFVLRPFIYDVGVNKGVSFGLQGVMKIADDQNIGGEGTSNPASDFHGVSIDTSAQAASVNAASLF